MLGSKLIVVLLDGEATELVGDSVNDRANIIIPKNNPATETRRIPSDLSLRAYVPVQS